MSTHTQIHTNKNLPHMCKHTDFNSFMYTHKHTHTYKHTHTLRHTHTHSDTHTHTQTHTHTIMKK